MLPDTPQLSCNRALLTYELIENILLHATLFEICAATQVCRLWRNVVENSKALRNHLYGPWLRPCVLSNADGVIHPSECRYCRGIFGLQHPAGTLFRLRMGRHQHPTDIWLLVPASHKHPIIALDRYKRELAVGEQGGLSFVWRHEGSKSGEDVVITRVICQFSERQYDPINYAMCSYWCDFELRGSKVGQQSAYPRHLESARTTTMYEESRGVIEGPEQAPDAFGSLEMARTEGARKCSRCRLVLCGFDSYPDPEFPDHCRGL